MASSSQIHPPDPNAPPAEYGRAVAASIQDLVTGRRPRDPVLSGASTGRLVVEGAVETLKIYRLYLEEKMSRAEETKGKGQGREGKRDGRRHRHCSSADDTGGDRERIRHRKSRPSELQGDGSPEDHLETHSAHHLMSGALHAAESALGHGPDGTPFGLLPTRGKGVGWMPHVKAVHRHIRAEQNAGLRSKGLAEKCIDNFLQERRAKGHGKEPVVEEVGNEGNEAGGGGGRSSRKLRKRRGKQQAGSDNDPSDGQEVHPSRQIGDSIQHPALSARGEPYQMQLLAEEGRTYSDRRGKAVVEETNTFAEARSENPYVPVVRFQSPTPPRQLTPVRLPTPRGSRNSHGSDNVRVPAGERDVVEKSIAECSNQDGRRSPIVPLQSTPRRQTTSVRLLAPQEHRSHHDREDVVVPAVGRAAVRESVEGSGSQDVPHTPIVPVQSYTQLEQTTSVRLPTPASHVTLSLSPESSFSASRSSLLPMFLLDEESAARPEEAQIEHSRLGAPVYEATPYSTNVEALEHAQAVEELERRQEAEDNCHTKTPLTAPQPKVALPTSFEAGLMENAHLMNLTKQEDGGLPKAPERCKSPRTKREMEDSSFQPGKGDLIDLRSNRCASSDSWSNRDAANRKLIWGQEPDWDFNNLNKLTET